MITLLQRVSEASVEVEGKSIANIGEGMMVLIAVQPDDDQSTAQHFLNRLLNYRVFSDAEDKMNLSLIDIQGELLLVPQFTLAANTRKGRRPSFTSAATPAHGQAIFEIMVKLARAQYARVESGKFGANMQVQLVNSGPVSFLLD